MRKLLRRLLRPILGYTQEEIAELFERLVREGYLEVIGLDHGDPIYKTTEKGRKFLAERRRT